MSGCLAEGGSCLGMSEKPKTWRQPDVARQKGHGLYATGLGSDVTGCGTLGKTVSLSEPQFPRP